jgi:hypothetical protein
MNQQKFNEYADIVCFLGGLAIILWFIWHKAGWDWMVLAIGVLLLGAFFLGCRRGPRP